MGWSLARYQPFLSNSGRLRSETAGPNRLGFVEVTFCDIGLGEISSNSVCTATLLSFLFIFPPYIIICIIIIPLQSTVAMFHPPLHSQVVMCRLGSARIPRLRLGFRELGLGKKWSPNLGLNSARLRLGIGLGRGIC
jgi:hypothetical protein